MTGDVKSEICNVDLPRSAEVPLIKVRSSNCCYLSFQLALLIFCILLVCDLSK